MMSVPEPLTTPSPTPDRAARNAKLAVNERRVLRSEWIKLWSVRSTVIGFAAAALTLIVLGALFSYFAEGAAQQSGGDDGPPGATGDSITTSLGGMLLAQIIVAVLGVLFVSSEYASGMIRVTLAAVPSRLSILWGKAIVIAVAMLLVMGLASLAAFVLGDAVYGGPDATYSLTDPEALRAVLGTAAFAATLGVIGVAFGFLFRSAAGAIGVLVALLLIAPLMAQLLPDSVSGVEKLLPSNAGEAIRQVTTSAGGLSAGAGLLVLAGWIAVLLTAAAVVLKRRDA